MKSRHPVELAFRKFFSQKDPDLSESYIIAVSGGLDSMVLLDLCRKNLIKGWVVHCNFRLRSEASDQDERLVTEVAAQAGYPYLVRHFETKSIAKERGKSIQETAREIRYEWFAEICKEKGSAAILTAHHADDAIETFFINLLRGTGPGGLTGIKMHSEMIFRPLVGSGKNELHEYAIQKGISWREDSSNSENKYLRNLIRNQILPLMASARPGFSARMLENLKIMQSADEILSETIHEKKAGILSIRKGKASIEWAALMNSKGKELILYSILASYGFSGKQSLAMSEIKQLRTGTFFQSLSHKATASRGRLIIEPLNEGENVIISIEDKGDFENAGIEYTELKYSSIQDFKVSPSEALFDIESVTYPLQIRNWMRGDKFMPFGMTGMKNVSDFLTDEKVDSSMKKSVRVLVSGNTILWVVGYRSDQRFKVSEKSKKVIHLRLSGE